MEATKAARASFTARAYRELLDAILERPLPPGTLLVPEALAGQLGVSVTGAERPDLRRIRDGAANRHP